MRCEIRRQRLTRPRVGLPAALAFLLGATGCGGEPETRRVFAHEAIEWVERESVTRPAHVVTSPLAVELPEVSRGRFVAHLGLRGAGEARARVSLRADDLIGSITGHDVGECPLDGTASDTAWRRCEIPISRDLRDARLAFDVDGGAELLVGAPRFEAASLRSSLPPVFVIVLDTTRADAYRVFAPKSAIGAELEALARDGIVFSRARSPSAWTRTAIASLLTGQSPFAHRVLDRLDVLGPHSATLQEALQDAGYVTRAWSSNPNVLGRWGFARGFDAFEDVGTSRWALVKPDGNQVLDRVQAELEQDGADGGFFYIHLMDPHQPYKPDAESLAELDRLTGNRYPLPRAGQNARARAMQASYRKYLAEVLESDEQVGRLLSLLRERGEYDRALIAVVSDHGEEFLDHAGSGHGKTLYEEMLRVPLLLKLPGARLAGTRNDAEVGLADLAATLLSALALPPLPGGVGRDLLDPDLPATPRLARLKLEDVDQGAIVHEGWKLVIDFAGGAERLFELQSDPYEERDRSAEQPDRADVLRAIFENRRFEHERGWHVRACSGATGGRLALELEFSPEAADLETRMLEATDRVESRGASVREVAFDLSLRDHPTERVLARVRPTLPDADELVILPRAAEGDGAETAIELRALEGGELLFTLGASGELQRAPRLRPSERATSARVSAGTSIRCVAGGAPHWKIWYVDAPASGGGAVDPALAERLRALGYGD